MSRRPFDPGEIDRDAADLASAGDELERYAALTATATPRDLDDRVMAAIEHEPTPRRGLLARLAVPWLGFPVGRMARTVVLAAALALAVGGVMAAGELVRIIRDASIGGPSSSPTESFVPSRSPSEDASPSTSESASPAESGAAKASPGLSATPGASDDSGGSPSATPQEQPTQSPSSTASPAPASSPSSTPEGTSSH